MAEPYLSRLRVLIDDLEIAGDRGNSIVCKHFFSGAAAWANGRIFISLSPAGLALKLPEEDCRALLESGGKRLRYFPKAPVKKGYAVLPEAVAGNSDALGYWIRKSLNALPT